MSRLKYFCKYDGCTENAIHLHQQVYNDEVYCIESCDNKAHFKWAKEYLNKKVDEIDERSKRRNKHKSD